MSDSQYVYLIKFDSNGNQVLPGLTNHAKQAHNAFDQLKEHTESLNGVLAKFGIGYLGWEMVGKLKEIGHEAVMTEAKFSRIAVVLANALGSKSEAQKNLDMIREFAATTPYQVDALSESFLKLANRGVVMKEPQMKGVGDLAASLGKDFGQVIDAVLLHSNSRVWRTIGIKSKLEEGKLKLTFRGITQTVEDTEAGALKAVTALGMLKGVAGATEAIMGTTGGKLSNLKDKADEMYKAMGERMKPLTDSWIDAKGAMFDWLEKKFEVTPQEKFEKEITSIRVLQTEMNSTNTTDEKRKEILGKLTSLNEDITRGIDKQSVSYKTLNENIERVIVSERLKIAEEDKRERKTESEKKQQQYQRNIDEYQTEIAKEIIKYAPGLASNDKLSFTEKAKKANSNYKAIYGHDDPLITGNLSAINLQNNAINANKSEFGNFDSNNNKVIALLESDKRNKENNQHNFSKTINDRVWLEGMAKGRELAEQHTKIKEGKEAAENIMKGGSSQKIINITVHKFQDKIEQHISSEPGDAKRKAEEVTDLMNEHLMRILNSANQMAN